MVDVSVATCHASFHICMCAHVSACRMVPLMVAATRICYMWHVYWLQNMNMITNPMDYALHVYCVDTMRLSSVKIIIMGFANIVMNTGEVSKIMAHQHRFRRLWNLLIRIKSTMFVVMQHKMMLIR
jgi:hypothetical protein